MFSSNTHCGQDVRGKAKYGKVSSSDVCVFDNREGSWELSRLTAAAPAVVGRRFDD